MSLGPAEIARIAAGMWAEAEREAAARARRHSRAPELRGPVRPPAAALWKPSTGQGGRRPVPLFALEEPPRGKRAPVLLAPGGSNGPISAGGGGRGQPSTAARLAAGYRPAVLKVVSYGHGTARATAIGQYIQKDEAALETHRGQILATQEAVAAEMKAWARDFDKRRPSDDVATFRVTLAGEANGERLAEAFGAAFAGHRYAYAIERQKDGSAATRVVATMAGRGVVRSAAGEETVRERFHLSADRSTGEASVTGPSRKLMAGRISDALGVPAEAVGIEPVGRAGHGRAGVVQQLARLAGRASARDQDGTPLATQAEVENTARSWDRDLNSFTPRDVMHMVLSAKADTDKDALVRAARGFLHAQFPAHKIAYRQHDDTAAAGHIHVHAIVAVKGEDGQRLRPGPADLRAWRASYAEHAQQEGMRVVAVSAAERASSQSYGPRDKAIVAAAERPRPGREARDRAYAQANPQVVEAARQRIARAQANPVPIPRTERQRAAVEDGLRDWQAVAAAQPGNPIVQQTLARLSQAQASGRAQAALREERSAAGPAEATAAEMRENLKDFREAVATAADLMEGETRADWLRRSAEVAEVLAIRTELKAREEAGVTEITVEEARRLLGPRAEAMIARAHEIQQAEEGQTEQPVQAPERTPMPDLRTGLQDVQARLDAGETEITVEEARRIFGPQADAMIAGAISRAEAREAERIRDQAAVSNRCDVGSSRIELASVDQVPRDRDRIRAAESIAQRERAETRAAATPVIEPDHDPLEHLTTEAAQAERLEELTYEQLHSTEVFIGRVDDDEVQAEKPASQRM